MPSPDEIHADPEAKHLPDAAANTSTNTSPEAAARGPIQADVAKVQPDDGSARSQPGRSRDDQPNLDAELGRLRSVAQ